MSVRNDAQRHKHSINASSAELRFAKVPMNLGVTAVMLPELDFPEQISLCRELGITCYQFRPRYIPPEHRNQPYSNWGNHKFDLTPQRLLDEGPRLRAQLEAANMHPHGTVPAVSIDAPDDTLLLHLRGAQVSGAGRIRCQPPTYPQKIFDYPAYLDATIARYRDVITRLARPLGVKLLIETHNQSAAASPTLAWNIVRHFSPTDLSVIFDIAYNFNLEGELRPSLAVSIPQTLDRLHPHRRLPPHVPVSRRLRLPHRLPRALRPHRLRPPHPHLARHPPRSQNRRPTHHRRLRRHAQRQRQTDLPPMPYTALLTRFQHDYPRSCRRRDNRRKIYMGETVMPRVIGTLRGTGVSPEAFALFLDSMISMIQ